MKLFRPVLWPPKVFTLTQQKKKACIRTVDVPQNHVRTPQPEVTFAILDIKLRGMTRDDSDEGDVGGDKNGAGYE